ncbi:MAG: PAS domain S-box protein [Chloroflexi bacterium]|nr:PAS domain S-box protein [Chloroflexota bacterium]MYD48478.1 PAS domain S-box protein [Chloroflexota bacterium]
MVGRLNIQRPAGVEEGAELQPELEDILRNAVRALGGSAAVVATWDDAVRRFVVTGAYGLDGPQIGRIRPLLNEAIPDLALSREQFALLSTLFPQSALPVSTTGEMQNPVMAVPLHTGEETVGLIFVLRSSDAANFSQLDPPVLAAFAEQAAIAVQSARLAHLLTQEKQRVESILEGSADGIYTVDAARRIVSVNPAMERLLGVPREELLGLPCAMALNWRDREGRPICPGRCPMLHSTDAASGVSELAATVRSRSGHSTEVALVYSVVRSPEQAPLNAVVNVRDMTRVREVENMRSTFLSMLGHQLQTPLAIIKGYTNTLSRPDAQWDGDTLRPIFEAIEEETDHMSQLMNRLLLASRLESGELPISREQVNMATVAEKVVGRMNPASRNHHLSVQADDDLPPVVGDPALLEEVLVNLLDNAVKYSPGGGPVQVFCANNRNGAVTVAVCDAGVGVPRWESRRIFERFHRSQNPAAAISRGMGLGLYICDQIMKAHGGGVSVSDNPGGGSIFTLTFAEPWTGQA